MYVCALREKLPDIDAHQRKHAIKQGDADSFPHAERMPVRFGQVLLVHGVEVHGFCGARWCFVDLAELLID